MKFFKELRKRNFCKVGIVYVVAAWLAWQIVVLAAESTTLPDWTMSAFQLAVWVCFPIVMIAAWFLELTPEGLKLQKNVDPAASIARKTGRQLNRGIIMILAMALVLYLTDRFRDQLWSDPGDDTTDEEATGQVEHTESEHRLVVLNCVELPAEEKQGMV
jgi:hypothetical protein